jgi:hypothetical protein
MTVAKTRPASALGVFKHGSYRQHCMGITACATLNCALWLSGRTGSLQSKQNWESEMATGDQFVGRRAELEVLEAALQNTRDGRGQVVLLPVSRASARRARPSSSRPAPTSRTFLSFGAAATKKQAHHLIGRGPKSSPLRSLCSLMPSSRLRLVRGPPMSPVSYQRSWPVSPMPSARLLRATRAQRDSNSSARWHAS